MQQEHMLLTEGKGKGREREGEREGESLRRWDEQEQVNHLMQQLKQVNQLNAPDRTRGQRGTHRHTQTRGDCRQTDRHTGRCRNEVQHRQA